jgi:hypothetical protein
MEDIKVINPSTTDWIAGAMTPLETPDLVANNDWSYHLPVVEYQNNWNYDRSACGDYAVLNALEILYHFHTKREINWSDRELAKMSGTTFKDGGWLSQIFDEARNGGLLLESEWPDTPIKADYYKEIPHEILSKRVKYEMYREWIPVYNKDLIFKSLNQAPLVVLCRYANGDGILNPVGAYCHFVTIFKAEKGQYWEVFDHYSQSRKKYAWDYEFGCVLKPTLIINNKKPYMKNNAIYQLVQGTEQKTGLYVQGQSINGNNITGLLIGDSLDVIVNGSMKANSKDLLTPVPLTLSDWNSVEHFNMKGEKI